MKEHNPLDRFPVAPNTFELHTAQSSFREVTELWSSALGACNRAFFLITVDTQANESMTRAIVALDKLGHALLEVEKQLKRIDELEKTIAELKIISANTRLEGYTLKAAMDDLLDSFKEVTSKYQDTHHAFEREIDKLGANLSSVDKKE